MLNLLVLRTALTLVTCLEYMLMLRAIMSWFPQVQSGKLFAFIYGITEPVLLPFRKMLQNVRALRGFPIDISFMLAFLTIILVELMLQGMVF